MTSQAIKEHRHVDFTDIQLIPRLFTIQIPDENVNAGHALFLHDSEDRAILWHIYVLPAYRERGFAKNLLQAAQKIYKEIITDWTSTAGENLCRSMGFINRKNAGDFRLIWRKET
jgi:ribosomal protein S18 acetylase RimI-like enzyme